MGQGQGKLAGLLGGGAVKYFRKGAIFSESHMPISLTAQNVDIVLGDPNPVRLNNIIPEVFEQLLEPNLDEFTRYTYCVSLSITCRGVYVANFLAEIHT